MPALTRELNGATLYAKRDDCTGLAFGGNKARQLEFHLGQARAEQATVVLITGAVQSNYVRSAAAAAAKLGLSCHVQLEHRVDGMPGEYTDNGNALLNHLFGATVTRYPVGEDESGADRALDDRAARLRDKGEHPYVIHLGAGYPPIGALAYVEAAEELLGDFADLGCALDDIVVGSGSAATHAGLLVGSALAGHPVRIHGICVRRPAGRQRDRVISTVRALERLLGMAGTVEDERIIVIDRHLGPGYGHPGEDTIEAMQLAARREGIVLDPVYTGKVFAGLVALVRDGILDRSRNAAFIHTGGTPAVFAYPHLGTRFGRNL